MKTKKEEITDELLLRCLEGTANREEYEEVWQWAQLPENKQHYQKMLDAFIASNLQKPIDQEAQKRVWSRIEKEIQLTKKPKTILHPMLLRWTSVAAILVFVYIAGTQIFGKEKTYTINAAEANISVITLSDGTKVWLNRGTDLAYTDDFGKEKREVSLTGEAYFEVAKDVNRPFIVKTGTLNVEVLGTQFNVKSYPKDHFITTTLVEGLVKVQTDAQTEILIPGQQLQFDKTRREIEKYDVDCNLYIAWKDRQAIFDQKLFKDILAEMEQNFNVTIHLEDQKLGNKKATGRYSLDEQPAKILEILSQSLSFDFRIQNDTIFIE